MADGYVLADVTARRLLRHGSRASCCPTYDVLSRQEKCDVQQNLQYCSI
jgi:hypothetical protein